MTTNSNDQSSIHVGYGEIQVGNNDSVFGQNLVFDRNIQNIFDNAASTGWLIYRAGLSMSLQFRRHGNLRSLKVPLVHRGVLNATDGNYNIRYVTIKDASGRSMNPTIDSVNIGTNYPGGAHNGFADGVISQADWPSAYHRMLIALAPQFQTNDSSNLPDPVTDPKTQQYVNDAITEIDIPGTQIGNIFKHPRGRNWFFNEVGQAAFSTGVVAIKGAYAPPEERLGSNAHIIYYTKSGGTGVVQGGFGDSAGVVSNGTTPAQFSKSGGGSFTAPMATDPDGYYIVVRDAADPLQNGTFKIVSFIDANTVGIDSKAVGQSFSGSGLTWTLRKGPIAEYFVRKRPYLAYGSWTSGLSVVYNMLLQSFHTGDFQSSSIENRYASPQRTVHDCLGHWWSVTTHWPGQSTDYRGGIRRWLHMSPQPHDPVYLDGDLQKPATGTAVLTLNSAIVTGSGTTFTTQFANGDRIRFGTQDTARTISSVDSNTQITLTAAWTSATTGALPVWRIMPAGAQKFRDIRCEPEKPTTLTGTVSATHGSITITGVGTSFTTDFSNMEVIKLNGKNYRVDTVSSNTSMTLQTPYQGKALSGVAVIKVPRQNLWVTLGGWVGQNARLIKIDPAPGWNSRFPEYTLVAGKQTSITTNDGFQSGNATGLVIDDSGTYSGGTGTQRIWVALGTDQTSPYVPIQENWGGLAYSDDSGATWKRLHKLPVAHSYFARDTTVLDSGCFVRNGSAVVTSNGSLFSTEFATNDRVMFDDDSETIYTVQSVGSNTQLTLTSNYSLASLAGTVSINSGTTTVTGSGTSFMTDYRPGAYINLNPSNAYDLYQISTVDSNTSLTITSNYANSTLSSGPHNRSRLLYKVLAGTASLTNGSNSVTGSGTSWNTTFAVGDWVRFGKDTRSYEVVTVGATSMTLGANYAGTTRASVPVMKGALLPWEATLYRDYRFARAVGDFNTQYGSAPSAAPIDYDTLGNLYWVSEAYPAQQTTSGDLPADPLPAATTSLTEPATVMRRICKWDQSTGRCLSFSEYGWSGDSAVYSINGYQSQSGLYGISPSFHSAKRLSVARIPKQHSTQSDHPLHNSLWVCGDNQASGAANSSNHGVSCVLAKHLTTLNRVLTGTVSITNGSAAVVGVGTTFTTDLKVNSLVSFEASSQPWTLYRVLSITDNLNMTLTSTFTGTTIGGTTLTLRQGGAAAIRYHSGASSTGTPDTLGVSIQYSSNWMGATNVWHDRNTGSIQIFSHDHNGPYQWSVEMAAQNTPGGIGSVIYHGQPSIASGLNGFVGTMPGVESDTIGMGWFCNLIPNYNWNSSSLSSTFGQYAPTWLDKRWDAETQTWKTGVVARNTNDLVMDGTNFVYGVTPGYGSRRAHETAEPFEDGMSIQFNQLGGASPQSGEFISDETSTFVSYLGSGKDNTQEATISYSYYTSPTVYRVNDTIKKVKNWWTAGDRTDNDIGIDGGFAINTVTGSGTEGALTGFPQFCRGITEYDRYYSSGVSWGESAIQRFDLNSGSPTPNPQFDPGGGVFVGMTCLRVPDRITVGGGTEPANDISLLGNNVTSVGYTFTSADIGRSVIIEGATNSANNGQAVITSIVSGTTATTDKAFVTEATSVGKRWKLRDIPAVGIARWDHNLGSPDQFVMEYQFVLYSSADYGQTWSSVKTWTTGNSGQAPAGPDNRSAGTYMTLGLGNKDIYVPDSGARWNSLWFDLTDLPEASRRRQYWKVRITRPTGGSNIAHYPLGLRLMNADRTLIVPTNNKLPDVDDPMFYGSLPVLQPLVVATGTSISRSGTANTYDMTDTVTTSVSLWEDNRTDGVVTITGTFASASATPFTMADVGKYIRITGATNSTNNGYALITGLVSPTAGVSQTVQTSKTFVVESSLVWAKTTITPGDLLRIDSTTISKSQSRALNDVYFTILDVPTSTTMTFADAVIPRFTGGVAWDVNRTSNPRTEAMRQVTNFTTLGYVGWDSQFGVAYFSDNLELTKISTGSATGTTPADDDGDGRSDLLTIPLQADIQNGDVIEVWGNTHGRRFYTVKSFTNGANTVVKTDFDELHVSQTYSWTLYRRKAMRWRAARTITTVRTL